MEVQGVDGFITPPAAVTFVIDLSATRSIWSARRLLPQFAQPGSSNAAETDPRDLAGEFLTVAQDTQQERRRPRTTASRTRRIASTSSETKGETTSADKFVAEADGAAAH